MINIPDKVVEKINANHSLSITFTKSCRLLDCVEKRGRSGQATDDNIVRPMRFGCWIKNQGYRQTPKNVILIAFPLKQSSRERTSILRLCAHCFPCIKVKFVVWKDFLASGTS